MACSWFACSRGVCGALIVCSCSWCARGVCGVLVVCSWCVRPRGVCVCVCVCVAWSRYAHGVLVVCSWCLTLFCLIRGRVLWRVYGVLGSAVCVTHLWCARARMLCKLVFLYIQH